MRDITVIFTIDMQKKNKQKTEVVMLISQRVH